MTKRAEVDVRLADFSQKLEASLASLNAVSETLDDLKYYAEEESDDFQDEAQRRNIPLQDMQMQQGQTGIPGLGVSRLLAQFLETAAVDDLSDVIELDDVFIVARVAAIQPEGYRSLEEVEDEIRPRALLEKKRTLQRERMEQAYAEGGFDGLANALGMTARAANNLSFSNQLVPGLGRDAIFAGTLLGLAEGEYSGVVEGANGVFVARVTRLTEPTPIAKAERVRLRNLLLNRQKATVQRRWIASLREEAEIEDLRNTFIQ